MTRLLNLQDFDYPSSYSLHEAIIQALAEAESGAGTFAFVTENAVNLILRDVAFQDFLQGGDFYFLTGIDQITNVRAIDSLAAIQAEFPNFRAQAFFHNKARSLYHPKFCWFKNTEGGTLIIGSNNFTIGGLRSNREAFTVLRLSEDEINEVMTSWNDWLTHSEANLKDLTDAEVIRRAARNRFIRRAVHHRATPEDEETVPPEAAAEEDQEAETWTFTDTDQVLIAEIPRSGDRWKQVNFDRGTFEHFFGTRPGNNSQRVLFRHVNTVGELEDIEVRQSVSVKSNNHRFELNSASGIDYPDTGRPIAVFIRIAQRMFIYRLVMPDDQPTHRNLDIWIRANAEAGGTRLERIQTVYSAVVHILDRTPLRNFKR